MRHRSVLLLMAGAMAVTACASSSTADTSGTGVPVTPAPSDAGSTSTAATNASNVPIYTAPEQESVQHLEFKYGPIKIEPGQNNITISDLQVPKPTVDGYIVGIHPDLVRNDGSIPAVDVIHLHHGVWLKVDLANVGKSRKKKADDGSTSTAPSTTAAPAESTTPATKPLGGALGAVSNGGKVNPSSFGEIFFASGEEKTKVLLPPGYGYPYKASDVWVINYMLHNLLSTPDEVSIVYNLDFIPADSPGAAKIKNAHPIWNDVEAGHLYPVFDVFQGTGTNGQFTYPDDDPKAYEGRGKPNEWVVDRDSVLLGTAGHLHPGGLHTDMYVTREGAGAGATEAAKASIAGDKAHVFRSEAVYYEPAGAVSWDVSMTATPEDWKVSVKKGDTISISATYDTTRASWYESMGIMVLWAADAADATGVDPYVAPVDVKGVLTHGHLAENDNHGGEPTTKFKDMTGLPNGATTGTVTIADFAYAPGDMSGIFDDVPTVKPGAPLKFVNSEATANPAGIWHTITACKAPCTGATGVAFPLANGDVQFDSGQLGDAGVPTAGRLDWTIPSDLPNGTYTYFCRIHPSMRGAFRVDPSAG